MGECDDDLSGSGGSSAGTTNRSGVEGNGRYRLMKSWRRRFGHHWPFVRKLSGEFLSQRTGNTELWYCVVSLSKLLDKVYLSVMWDVLMLMWRHFNGWVCGNSGLGWIARKPSEVLKNSSICYIMTMKFKGMPLLVSFDRPLHHRNPQICAYFVMTPIYHLQFRGNSSATLE